MQTFTNGSSHMQMVQCKVKWFNHKWSGGMMKQMVLCEIKWFCLTYNIIVGAETTKNTRVKWTSQDMELSCLCGVWRNLYLWTIYIRNVFVAEFKKKIKKRNCKPVLNNLKQKKKNKAEGFGSGGPIGLVFVA